MPTTDVSGPNRPQRSFSARLRVALAVVVAPCVAVGAVAFVGFGRAADDVRRIQAESFAETALIGELQREMRHAEVEVNLIITANHEEAREALHRINLLLETAFDLVAQFDSEEEVLLGARAEESWREARAVAAPLSLPGGQLDEATFYEFHLLVDVVTSELFALEAESQKEFIADMAVHNRAVDRYRQALLLAIGAAFVITLWVARRLRLAAYRPLRQLESSLAQVSGSGLRTRVQITGDREFHAVADALNDMSDRLQNTIGELERQAFHDPLTGLPNRSLLERSLATALADPNIGPVGVVMLDLDGFKAINDGLGHPAGDEVLIAVAERLKSSLRPSDMVGRLGGDEFAVVATDMSPDGIAAISARLKEPFEQPLVVSGLSLLIGSSAGAALAQPGESPSDLFRHADIALYSAKDAGKSRLHVFESRMLDEVEHRLTTQNELRAAVETDQIVVHYQPIVRCRSGRIVGVEALARWNHPTRGLLAPASFISLAEDSGLIVPLGKIVLDMACAQVAAWQKIPALEALSVSVNVSARQLRTADIVEHLRTALSASGLPPASLTLEVTESITADATAVAMLHELRNLGVRIALDDFGTGYSSLSYLERLPIDVLKIDKGFVDNIHTRASRASLAGTIIRLGRSFGLTTVGEGIETPEQLLLLTELGCELAQGYLIARPGPPDTIEATLIELAEGAASPQTAADDINTVIVRVGPVAGISAVAWLAYTSDLLDRIRSSPSEYFGIPPGVLAAIETYVKRWSEVATTSDPFLWTGREDPSILRAITHYWFQLAELRASQAALAGEIEAPVGLPFNEALVSAILVALTVGADADLEAEAIAWQRSWPTLPTDEPEPVPA